MNIITISEADLERYWALRLEALKTSPEAFGSDYETDQHLPLAQVRERVRGFHDENFVVAAEADGQLLGMVGFLRNPRIKTKHKGFIWGVFVRSEARGQGVGRTLMEETLRRARQMEGLLAVHLTVVATNTSAKTLYETLGFKAYGLERRALLVNGTYYDEILMELDLD